MDNGEFIFSPILSIIEISAAEYRGGDFLILDDADGRIGLNNKNPEGGSQPSRVTALQCDSSQVTIHIPQISFYIYI